MNTRLIPPLALAALLSLHCDAAGPPEEPLDESTQALTPCMPADELPYFPNSSKWVMVPPPPPLTFDITANLQNTINTAFSSTPREGRVVVIPKGNWTISRTIYIGAAGGGSPWVPNPGLRAPGAYGATIVGEVDAASPTTPVKLTWAGAPDLDMFVSVGVQGLKLTRLLLDGNHQPTVNHPGARIGVHLIQPNQHGQTGWPSDHHEFTDSTFQNMQYGIVVGSSYTDYAFSSTSPEIKLTDPSFTDTGGNNGTSVVRRSHFLGIRERVRALGFPPTISLTGGGIGLVLSHGNAFDWDVFDSEFARSRIGVLVGHLGGTNVFHSNFSSNLQQDLCLIGTDYAVVRDNVSIGSKQFLWIPGQGNMGTIGVIGNAIDTQSSSSPSVQVDTHTALLLKNTILSKAGVAALQVGQPHTGYLDLVEGANIFNQGAASAITTLGGTAPYLRPGSAPIGLSDVVASPVISPLILPPMATPIARTVQIEVTPGTGIDCTVSGGVPDTTSPQDCAAKVSFQLANGSAPISVHFAGGLYSMSNTVLVPRVRDVLIAGDGENTQLFMVASLNPPTDGVPFFRLEGPSHASVRDIVLASNAVGFPVTGVLVAGPTDDVSSRVYVDDMSASNFGMVGAALLGHDKLSLTMEGGSLVGFRVGARSVGLGAASVDRSQTKGISIFGGELDDLLDSVVDVGAYGKIVAQGVDMEAYPEAGPVGTGYVTLSDGRHVTINGTCAPGSPPRSANDNFSLSGLVGSFTMVDYKLHNWIDGRGSSAEILGVNIRRPDMFDGMQASCFVAPPAGLANWGFTNTCCSCALPASDCSCGSTGFPTPASACPFVALDATGVAAGRQSNINGRFWGNTVCPPSLATADDGCADVSSRVLDAGRDPRIQDLLAASSNGSQSQCGTTDVRIHRLMLLGSGVPEDLRYGLVVQ